MKWIEIKEKYPKAFKLLESQKNFVKVLSRQNMRLLYDFFDENEIYVQVDPKCALDWSVWFVGYIWAIKPDINEYIEEENQSRTIVEKATFMKAFELLEEKLK